MGCIACPIALWQRLSLRQYAANNYRLKDDGTKPSATDAHRRHFVICALRLSVRIDRVDGGIRPRWKGRSLGVPSGDAGRARLPDLYGDGVDRGESRSAGPAFTGALVLTLAVAIQAALGILTLIYKSPLALALTHQGMAMVALTIAVVHADRLVVKRPESRVGVMTSLSTY